jgi:hypothetical protein
MALLDTVQDVFRRVFPPTRSKIPPAPGAGIGGGGHAMFQEEDVSVPVPSAPSLTCPAPA